MRLFHLVLVWLLCVAGFSRVARADSYSIEPNYQIACVDLKTGREVWITKPNGPLSLPLIRAAHGALVVEAQDLEQKKTWRYWLDPASGAALKPAGKINAARVTAKPLDEVPRQLKSVDGRVFEYAPGSTRHLTAKRDGKSEIVRKLDAYVHALWIHGPRAIFNYSGSSVRGTGGGEVYAYDYEKQKLAWEFDASSKLPKLGEAEHTSLHLSKDRLLLQVDQVLFSLDATTGKLHWMAKLPRQPIRRYDSPWTSVARLDGGDFLVSVYETLFRIRARDGRVLWSYDTGAFGSPWPTLVKNRAYVGVLRKRGKKRNARLSGGIRPQRFSSVTVVKDARTKAGFRFEFQSRRDLPKGEAVYWSLRDSPAAAGETEYTLRFSPREGDSSKAAIGGALKASTRVHAKFGMWTDVVVLLRGGKEVLRAIVPKIPRDPRATAE